MSDLRLTPAEPSAEDARLVMSWRNDPHTLAMSFHQSPKRWPDFLAEFREHYFPSMNDQVHKAHNEAQNAFPPPQFGVVNAERIGFLRFRAYPAEHLPPGTQAAVDISIMIAPAQRGRGYGLGLVQLGTAYAHECGWEQVVAEVKPANAASLRLFKKAGYAELDTYTHHIADLPAPINVIRFLHPSLSPISNI